MLWAVFPLASIFLPQKLPFGREGPAAHMAMAKPAIWDGTVTSTGGEVAQPPTPFGGGGWCGEAALPLPLPRGGGGEERERSPLAHVASEDCLVGWCNQPEVGRGGAPALP